MSNNSEATRLAQRQKLEALGQFAGGIAHDFNNILSIIEGYTHIATKQLKDGTLTPEQLHKILLSTQRGAGLTRQLLSFGRQKVSVDEKTDLAEALRQIRVLLCPLLGGTVRLLMTLPEEPVWLNASPDLLTQVTLNLALNARDAMPGGGELSIVCMFCQKQNVPRILREKYAGTEFACLHVIDSGGGIPPDILPRIFDPFFTTKDVGKGTGLGLSVVYGIVDQLKGVIEVSSVVGEGTRFDIYLPLTSAPAAEGLAEEDDPLPDGLAGKTILIAEDEPELRGLLSDMFSGMQMKVLSAGNGDQALVVQDEYEGDIDFLLTDVVMPDMDGVRLGAMFTSIRPDSNVIYMSGYPFMDGRKDLRVPEDSPLIGKPLQEGKIREILERALQRKRERLGE
ncbi:MAG: response regulator [Alphaproteobacteria bacterium]|nr:response regulator [Alphaproteobacteria bacterium]